jgi:hypothetical protein
MSDATIRRYIADFMQNTSIDEIEERKQEEKQESFGKVLASEFIKDVKKVVRGHALDLVS